eukprot:gnl/TRDRNA2_/TRDRNA2_155597_c0_seq1.p1 gnl/TRDRNA2_/TRDRNA2_155597_c0~~gnl/TRDRNA2_/TRDRNA2_155597_c0_seq1.p1  ORF type:complete len:390 (-),score=71.25 gnl/TRDRNA2_/TRDRNA2_155597_c0_seq1:32-1201(-)
MGIEARYVAVDVECAATGKGHNDRAPCRVGVVDYRGKVLMDQIISVPNLVSPLTPITGLTRQEIEGGRPCEEVVAEVKSLLGKDVTLVGQYIDADIEWLDLHRSIDFKDSVDIASKFRTFNKKHGTDEYYSLAQEVYALLGQKMVGSHSPVEDSKYSMALFREYVQKPAKLRDARDLLMRMKYNRKFPALNTFKKSMHIDGVCGGKFNKERCFCGQSTVTPESGTGYQPTGIIRSTARIIREFRVEQLRTDLHKAYLDSKAEATAAVASSAKTEAAAAAPEAEAAAESTADTAVAKELRNHSLPFSSQAADIAPAIDFGAKSKLSAMELIESRNELFALGLLAVISFILLCANLKTLRGFERSLPPLQKPSGHCGNLRHNASSASLLHA